MMPYAIIDGIRMDKADVEHLLAVLDPIEDPDMWERIYRRWKAMEREKRHADKS